jgi:acyl CoA:acetate/3-ketoacid CoA transferase beta subunit
MEREPSGIDMICVCIAREVRDGDFLGQGTATPLVAAGYMLAKLTHAPHCTITYTVGNAYSNAFFPVSVLYHEKNVLDHALHCWSFTDTVRDVVAYGRMNVELFRPAQIDMYGNTNNVVIGDYYAPTVRLPGCGGICDATTAWDRIYYYVPKHEKAVFVGSVDFRSGRGHRPRRAQRREGGTRQLGKGPTKVFTDLGVLGFDERSGRMRLLSLHPGVSLHEIKANTGFELLVPGHVANTEPATAEEIGVLNERVDPCGVRFLETLPNKERKRRILDIVGKELDTYRRRGR